MDTSRCQMPASCMRRSCRPRRSTNARGSTRGNSSASRPALRARNAGREAEEFPEVDVPAFFNRLGAQLRRMHDAGIWHRDVSIGNLLVRLEEEGPVFFLIDLNRARLGRRLGVVRRNRDLCRLRILRREDRRRLLDAYWGEGGAPAWKRASASARQNASSSPERIARITGWSALAV